MGETIVFFFLRMGETISTTEFGNYDRSISSLDHNMITALLQCLCPHSVCPYGI